MMSIFETSILLTSHKAIIYAVVTAADDDKPPIGNLPETTAFKPTYNTCFSCKALTAPRI